MRQRNVTALILALAIATGCNGAGFSSKNDHTFPTAGLAPAAATTSGSSTTNPPATSGFAVASFSPKTGPATTKSLTVVFSKAVEPGSLVQAKTWLAAEADQPGANTFHTLKGTLDLDAAGTTATFTPQTAFTSGKEVRFLLTKGVMAKGGGPLEQGSASDPLSFTQNYPDQIFEGRFAPGGSTTTPSTGVIPPPTSPPTTPPPPPSVAGAFEVVRTTPKAGASEPVPTSIWIELSSPVDKTTVVGGSAPTVAVFQATSSPNSFTFPQFGVRFDQNDRRMEIVPQPLFTAGFDMFIVLTSGIKDTSGKALTTGAASSALTKKTWIASEIFELRFTPQKVPYPQLGNSPSIYQLEPGTDPWFIDFDVRGVEFSQDMSSHGLLSSDTTVDKLAKERLEVCVLAFVSLKYGRTPDGKGQPGAWKISFTAAKPASGIAGRDYSRHPIGGRPPSGGTLGISTYDVGNQTKDDNATPGKGIFTAGISGIDSKLTPPLTAADLKFLDGTYKIGQGSSTDDERMRRIAAVTEDWGRAIGSVLSHEVGHSVGLSHVNDRLSIMDAAATSSQLSEPRQSFQPSSAALLDANLGKM